MLASLSSVLAWAEENGCAAAAFDTPNLELLLAAIGAAEHRGEPVIIQHAQRQRHCDGQNRVRGKLRQKFTQGDRQAKPSLSFYKKLTIPLQV